MNFNSLEFLIFLPVVLIGFMLLPHKIRWAWLLISSYYFYMSWNAWLIFLILGTTVVSYASAIAIDRVKNKKIKTLFLVLTLIVCLGTLIFFKYFNFLIQSAIDFLNLFSMNINSVALDIILPVGISFYTFQTLSYVIDVYRGKFKPEYHFGYYALFVSYFPQLVAGPIERPGDLLPQLKADRRPDAEDISSGLRILLTGFFRKCVVADFCGVYVTNVFGNLGNANSLAVFMAGTLFLVQIYCDFAGYSEIAAGAARLMGVKLSKNFDRPFLSVSFTEFFRRWHITLSKWFADYVYIPLGGNRKGTVKKIINTFIVFGLCGLWHGANWTYVAWGLSMAFFISIESLLRKPFGRLCEKVRIDLNNSAVKLFRRVLLFMCLVPTVLMFRASSLSQFGIAFAALFTRGGLSAAYFVSAFNVLGISTLGFIQIILSIICMAMIYGFSEFGRTESQPLFCPLYEKSRSRALYSQRIAVYLYAALAVGLCWFALMAGGDMSSFAYFQF